MTDVRPVVYGASYSVYVRAVRLALEEKGVAYDLVEVDVFAPGGPPPEHFRRHPFGRIPAFAHDGFALYESGAIERYVDEVFPGPPLQPSSARARARMNQVTSVLDGYAYRTLVWDIFVERVRRPARGMVPDERRIADALPRAAACLAALADLMGEGPWLAGSALSLADLHAAPMFACLATAP
ncbi:MAG: glutathione S-transferase, partial [Alphaproteobacteria bacterium]|nr:glutathione S-transferase [Alphaproteobacteria bacterium]